MPTVRRSDPDADVRRTVNELRQTGDPVEQLRDLDGTFERLAGRGIGLPSTSRPRRPRSWPRKNFAATRRCSWPRTAAARSTCSALRPGCS